MPQVKPTLISFVAAEHDATSNPKRACFLWESERRLRQVLLDRSDLEGGRLD